MLAIIEPVPQQENEVPKHTIAHYDIIVIVANNDVIMHSCVMTTKLHNQETSTAQHPVLIRALATATLPEYWTSILASFPG